MKKNPAMTKDAEPFTGGNAPESNTITDSNEDSGAAPKRKPRPHRRSRPDRTLPAHRHSRNERVR